MRPVQHKLKHITVLSWFAAIPLVSYDMMDKFVYIEYYFNFEVRPHMASVRHSTYIEDYLFLNAIYNQKLIHLFLVSINRLTNLYGVARSHLVVFDSEGSSFDFIPERLSRGDLDSSISQNPHQVNSALDLARAGFQMGVRA
jgi:hypothetical protein